MAYHSLVKLWGSTGQSEFAFDFPYMKEGDIYVFVNGASAPFAFLTPQTIKLTTPLAEASMVTIRRYTEITERLVDYQDVSELDEATLDTDSVQAFYLCQEAYDIASLAIVSDNAGNWDAHGGRIVNVGDAIDDMDAVNLRTFNSLLEDASGIFGGYVDQAEAAADRAEAEANRAAAEADAAYTYKEQTQAIHDATAQIKADTEQVYVDTVNERSQAQQAAEEAHQWALNSQYWYDTFRTYYHGARQDHPTGTIVPGAMYFNTTFSRLYFWSGVEWYSPTDDADRAEAARHLAESYRNEAEVFRDQAGIYAGQAQEAATDSQDAANSASQFAANSSNSAAQAANSATAAGYDADRAEAAADRADTFATEAAASAAEAEQYAQGIKETYADKGAWYVATGLPATPERSSMWTCVDGGDLNGIMWNAGDMLVFSEHIQQFGRLTGQPVSGGSDPNPVDLTNGAILGEGAALQGWAGGVLKWISYVDANGAHFGDATLPTDVMGTDFTFNGGKVFHEGFPPSYDDITGTPPTSPPQAHQHPWEEVTGKPATATRWPTFYEVTDKPVDYPPSVHSHDEYLLDTAYLPRRDYLATSVTNSNSASTDLNTRPAGDYLLAGSAVQNYPPTTAYWMYVETRRIFGADKLLQVAYPYNIDSTYEPTNVWWRNQGAVGSWTPWVMLYDTANPPTAADVGAAPTVHSHEITDVTGLREELDALAADAGTPPYDGIRDGVTATAPTENAVFDALAGKAASTHTHTVGDVSGAVNKAGDTMTDYLSVLHGQGGGVTVNGGGSSIDYLQNGGVARFKVVYDQTTGSLATHSYTDTGAWMSELIVVNPDGVGFLNPFTLGAQGSNGASLTRKDYVDGLLGGKVATTDQTYWHNKGQLADLNVPYCAQPGYFSVLPTTVGAPSVTYGHGFTWGPGGDAQNGVWYSQMIADHGDQLWYRNGINTTAIGPWHRIYTSIDPPTAADVGALPLTGGTCSGLVTAPEFYVSSDRRLKSEFAPLEDALNKVCSLEGQTYLKNDKRGAGLIAQDLQKVLPEAVHENDEGYLSIAPAGVVALLVEAVKELRAEVQELRNANA